MGQQLDLNGPFTAWDANSLRPMPQIHWSHGLTEFQFNRRLANSTLFGERFTMDAGFTTQVTHQPG